jgi:hypothetical protein
MNFALQSDGFEIHSGGCKLCSTFGEAGQYGLALSLFAAFEGSEPINPAFVSVSGMRAFVALFTKMYPEGSESCFQSRLDGPEWLPRAFRNFGSGESLEVG